MTKAWPCKCVPPQAEDHTAFAGWKCRQCGAYRWPGLLWGLGVTAGIGGLALLWLWLGALGGDGEARWLRQAQRALQTEGKFTAEKTAQLRELATQLGFSPAQIAALFTRAKAAHLEATRRALLRQAPGPGTMTPEKQQTLCQVAAALELPTETCRVPCASDTETCRVPCAPDPVACLRQGEFTQTVHALQTLPDHPAMITLRAVLDSPLGVQVQFQYQRGGETPSPLYPLEARELQGLVLSHRDVYRLMLSTATDATYLYVFQLDRYRQITRLFPDPVWSGVTNPIQPGSSYQIPLESQQWLYLDMLPPTQEVASQETLFIMASPWPAEDLEALYGQVYAATSREGRAALLEQFFARLRLRKTQAINALYYQEFSFAHER